MSSTDYKSYFDQASIGMFVMDKSANFVEVNACACDMTGYSLDELKRMAIPDVVSEPSMGRAVNLHKRVQAEGRGNEIVEFKTKSGELRQVNIETVKLNDDRFICYAADVTDLVNERKQAAEAEQKYRNIVDSSPMGIFIYEWTKEKKLVLRDANSSANDILGLDCSQKFGHAIEEAFPPLVETEIPERYKECASDGVPWHTVQVSYQDDDIQGAYEVFVFQTIPNNCAVLFSDVTKRKRIEHERKLLNKKLLLKTDELEQLIYIASHDLRSPLINIQGFSSEISEDLNTFIEQIKDSGGEDSRKLAKEIMFNLDFVLNGIHEMDKMMSSLLKISRIGKAKVNIKQINVKNLIENIKHNFEFQLKDQKIDFILEDLPSCHADERILHQVLSNLIDNAVKYYDKSKKSYIKISGKELELSVQYTVEDNGIGIRKENLDRILQLFHREDPLSTEGEGLGLSIVQRSLNKFGASIKVDADKGRGSRFIITIPKKD